MRFWFDTEFIDDGQSIDLISIGIVAEDGRRYYAVSLDANYDNAGEWVKANVLPLLPSRPETINYSDPSVSSRIKEEGLLWRTRSQIAIDLLDFLGSSPEMWAYFADYDWVVFCQIFGSMMDLPTGYPMYCRDLKQECDRLGFADFPLQENEHNALSDAVWCKSLWERLFSVDDWR